MGGVVNALPTVRGGSFEAEIGDIFDSRSMRNLGKGIGRYRIKFVTTARLQYGAAVEGFGGF